MDLQNLKETYPKLISHLKDYGYINKYVRDVERDIKHILRTPTEYESYADIYLKYVKLRYSKIYLEYKKRILGAIENFDKFELYPGCNRQYKRFNAKAYDTLSDEFKHIVDRYQSAVRGSELKESTILTRSSNIASFFSSLQKEGIYSLNMISEKAVLKVFTGLDGKLNKSSSYKKNLELIFKDCVSIFPNEGYEKVISYLPPLRRRRKNIQYLTEEEAISVKTALTTKMNGLPLRDKAIGLLALHTGIRGCDIAGLTVASINWERDHICFNQQKTGNPLQLKLTAVIGNAIYDYIANERPKVNTPEIFISTMRPYGRLSRGCMKHIAARIMRVAKIRENPDDRKGFHIFRHRLATKLLNNGTPKPIISEVLGHLSPNSLNHYLSADFKRLKECALSVDIFPLRKGVLK